MVMKFNACRKRGEWLVKILLKYESSFKKTSEKQDKKGTDLIRKNKFTHQVKCDQTIPKYSNLYFEMKEKTPEYEAGKWRNSPMDADRYILGYFVNGFNKRNNPYNDHIIIYIVSVKELNKIKENYPIKEIKPTSKGYLIPINNIKHKRKEFPKPKKEKPNSVSTPKPLFEI